MGWVQFVHPDDREAYLSAYDDAVRQRDHLESQFRFRRSDGEYRWVLSVAIPALHPTGSCWATSARPLT
jgi:PAS domain-containing protein